MKTKSILLLSKIIVSGFSLFFLLFLIGEGLPDLWNKVDPMLYYFLPLFFITILSFFLSFTSNTYAIYICGIGGLILLLDRFIKMDYSMGILFGFPYIVYAIIAWINLKK